MSAAKVTELTRRYRDTESLMGRFAEELTEQLRELLDASNVALSFPIQRRVKTWASIAEKIERKSLILSSLEDLTDLVGLRLILQFRRDVDRVCDLIAANFRVQDRYDTRERLREDQFGYSSIHFIVAMPESWLSVPTLKNMGGLRAEIQVRTTAQHIWASASHTLQYKHEESVPTPVRRSIHRVSALLETVDLEFDRVLAERDAYVASLTSAAPAPAEPLNVDSLREILSRTLPAANADKDENYASVLEDLLAFEIRSTGELEGLIDKHLPTALAADLHVVDLFRTRSREREKYSGSRERIRRGVFFTHGGLVREMLAAEFGEKWAKYQRSRPADDDMSDEDDDDFDDDFDDDLDDGEDVFNEESVS